MSEATPKDRPAPKERQNRKPVRIPARAAERSAARLAAVQALYQMDLAGRNVIEALAEFEAFWIGREVEGVPFQTADLPLFRDILVGVVREQRPIDVQIDTSLPPNWPLTRIMTVLRAILRAGVYELLFRPDIPARVAISEYVDLTRSFYDDDEPGLVNAVLDTIARETRSGELAARG